MPFRRTFAGRTHTASSAGSRQFPFCSPPARSSLPDPAIGSITPSIMKDEGCAVAERRPVQTCDACVGTEGEAAQEDSEYCCNICLELSKEPVVTLCGHLFCWSCLFRSVSHHTIKASLQSAVQAALQCIGGPGCTPLKPCSACRSNRTAVVQMDAGAELHARLPGVQGRRGGGQGETRQLRLLGRACRLCTLRESQEQRDSTPAAVGGNTLAG